MVTYNIKDNGDGTSNVKLVREPKSAERTIYASKPGGKPLSIGVNRAKRVARRADERDQLAVQRALGFGLPRQKKFHQELVHSRHRYYHEQHDEFIRAT